MGMVSTEQAVRIIEAVNQPEVVTKPETNNWWALVLVVVPVYLAWWLNKKKR
jgi:hypothetical protein